MPGVEPHSFQSGTAEVPDHTVDPVHLACFEAAGRRVAFEVGCVREIVRARPLAPLPGAPDEIEGVAELRGAVLPVLDLGRVLYGEACSGGPESRIAIVELEGMRVGVRVDSAVEVLTIAPDGIEATDALAGCAGDDLVAGLVRRKGAAPLVVLALDRLLRALARGAPVGEESA